MAATLEGLPIRDAQYDVELHVEPRDINNRNRKKHGYCALAECGKRELHAEEVRVYLSRAYVRQGDHWVRYVVSAMAQREIVSFDRGAAFEPGIYTLYAPVHRPRSGGKQPTPRVYTGKQMKVRAMTANIRSTAPIIRRDSSK